MQKLHLKELTGARFFAALGVLVVHFVGYTSPAPNWLIRGFAIGAWGVSFFFILSGFILAYNYAGWFQQQVRFGQYRDFLRARFARIYPMHFLALCCITPLCLYINFRTRSFAQGTTISWVGSSLLVQSIIPKMLMNWNGPAWSVSCEAFFYIICPLFLVSLSYIKFNKTKLIYMIICLYIIEVTTFSIVVIMRYRLGAALHILPVWAILKLAYCSPLFRVEEFLIGCCLGVMLLGGGMIRSRTMRNIGLTIFLAFLCIAFMAGVILPIDYLYMGISYPLATPVFAMTVLCLASGPTFLSWILGSPWTVLLGEASYSLYLLHWELKIALEHHFGNHTPWSLTLFALALTVIASIIMLKFVETPARQILRGSKPAPPHSIAGVLEPNAIP